MSNIYFIKRLLYFQTPVCQLENDPRAFVFAAPEVISTMAAKCPKLMIESELIPLNVPFWLLGFKFSRSKFGQELARGLFHKTKLII